MRKITERDALAVAHDERSLAGMKFERLTVLIDDGTRRNTPSGDSYRLVKVQCSCLDKTIKTIRRSHLITGHTKSCGCLNRELRAARVKAQTKHGMAKSPEWTAWINMRARCQNENNTEYRNYGGRGIKICDRWLHFENFYADMGSHPGKGWSINRKNNDGDYEPSNCEWATADRQAANKRYAENHQSRFRGVQQRRNKWIAKIADEYSGPFDTEKEAARAYDWKARKRWGDNFSYFNFNDDKSYDANWNPPIPRPVYGSRVSSIIGKRYNHLTVLEDNFTHTWYGTKKTGQKSRTILVRCDCGTIKDTNRQGVIDGRTRTCGRGCPFKKRRGPNKQGKHL